LHRDQKKGRKPRKELAGALIFIYKNNHAIGTPCPLRVAVAVAAETVSAS